MEDMNTNPMSGINVSEPTQSRGGHKGILKTLIVVIVALIVIWGAVKLFSGAGVSEEDSMRGYSVENAEQGEVVSSFPQEFLLESNAMVEGSSVLTYKDSGSTLPTVEYTSEMTLEQNIASFREALTNGGWAITKEASADKTPTGFYAIKGGNDINITLIEKNGVVKVYIAYVERVPVVE